MREPIAQCFVLAGEWPRARSHVRSLNPGSRTGSRAALLVGLVLLTTVACGGTYYTPTVAGVVSSIGATPKGLTVYELQDGQELTIDASDGSRVVYGGRPNVGDLLLSGTGPKGPWIARLFPAHLDIAPAGCYELDGGGTDRGDRIETDAGLRLRKAFLFASRRARQPGQRYHGGYGMFCVNSDGEAMAYLE